MAVLKAQLREKGVQPLEFIPLPHIRAELQQLFSKCGSSSGDAADEARMDYLLQCMEYNPEYRREKDEDLRLWRHEVAALAQECLLLMRGFIPAHIFSCSRAQLVADGVSEAVAKRLFAKKCLWLLRMPSADISRLHEADLMGKYSVESQGLDLVEVAALYAAIPTKFISDATGKYVLSSLLISTSLNI